MLYSYRHTLFFLLFLLQGGHLVCSHMYVQNSAGPLVPRAHTSVIVSNLKFKVKQRKV